MITICGIIPPHILEHIKHHGTPEQKELADQTLINTQLLRKERQSLVATPPTLPQAKKARLIYSNNHSEDLPGTLMWQEGDQPTGDKAVDQACLGTGATYDLYKQIYLRNSIDNHDMPLISTVHYEQNYDNAFWNGQQMVYGDGDGEIFTLFTQPIDVTGHELTHGVTQYSANLDYQDQSGALNESFSDVFGSLVKQKQLNQTSEQADWLIGAGIFTHKIKGQALRSMKSPGTAYDDPTIGKDPQPATMKDYRNISDDNGGVHVNSGIPNHAFYLTATEIGGFAWEKAGQIWYTALTTTLKHNANFQTCANATYQNAQNLYGNTSKEANAVLHAWAQVGVKI